MFGRLRAGILLRGHQTGITSRFAGDPTELQERAAVATALWFSMATTGQPFWNSPRRNRIETSLPEPQCGKVRNSATESTAPKENSVPVPCTAPDGDAST